MKPCIRKALTVFAAVMTAACRQSADVPDKTPQPEDPVPIIENYEIEHETEFGGVYIHITIDDFNRLGFVYGDSVDIVFSNGYTMEDIPYFSGYYVPAGKPLLVAYPGYPYIKAAVNYGNDLWEEAHLTEGMNGQTLWMKADLNAHDKATVKLREKGKYLDIQEARNISYTDYRKDYPSDEVFANFRMIQMGNIGENVLYRSASPCDNSHNRAPYVDELIGSAGVQCILNLADTTEKIEGYMEKDDFESLYFLGLYEKNKVVLLGLNMNYHSEEFAKSIGRGLIEMSQRNGPYLIHCTEGKDRTGFVCMVIEALAGASYQEIVDDYMLTYANYYEIDEASQPKKYKTIKESNIDDMIEFIVSDDSVDYKNCDLVPYVKNYLAFAGMSEEQIEALQTKLKG